MPSPNDDTNEPPALPHPPDVLPEQPLMEGYARFRSDPFEAFKEFGLHISGSGWRSYDTIVGQPIFYKGYTESMKRKVVNSTILKKKIRELADKRVRAEQIEGILHADYGAQDRRRLELEGQLREVAELWTDQMICKMESKRSIRGKYYLVTQLLTRAYHQGMFTHLHTATEAC